MTLQDTTECLGSAPLDKLIIKLSLPSMVSMITLALYSIIDTFWLGQLGYQAIAALTVIMPYHVFIIAVSVGSGIGVNALTSRRFGERNIALTNHIVGHIFIISGVLGAIFLIAAVFFSEFILNISGVTPDIITQATEYLTCFGYGVPFSIFAIVAANLLRASGDAFQPMVFMIAAAVINIILDPFLIMGISPFPEMGVRGAALATVISQAIGAGMSFYYILFRKSVYRIGWRHLRPGIKILRDIYRVGLPSMVMEVTESVVFALFNNILASFGSLYLAAVGITVRIADLAFMPMFGASQGLLPIIGFSFGAGLWKRLWRAVLFSSGGLALLMGLATIILEVFAPQLIAIFNDAPELLAVAVPAMRIVCSTLVIVGPTILVVTTFQGLSRGMAAMLLSLIRQFVFFVPLLFLLHENLGITGVWLSLPISDILAFIVSGLWLFREYHMQKQKFAPDIPPAINGLGGSD
ncbi:MATE family efflux transporter [Chloroflexota bacterium]